MSIRRVGSFKTKELGSRFNKFKREIPILLANEAELHFKEGFRKGGYQTDASRQGWKPRRSGRDRGRAILVKSADLLNDIKRRQVNERRVVVGTRNIEYATRHNEGLGNMPQREFIGESKSLDSKNKRLIERELNKVRP